MIDIQEAVMGVVPVQKGLAVEVRELRKEFRRKDFRKRGEKRTRVALDGVSFTMDKGETVAILGQNGSGKSTLVRLLSTLLLPDGGSARIFGYDVVSDERAVRRLVNRVSVEASFFKKMSSSENLGYASRFYGMPDWVQEIARFLPFQYAFYFPINSLIGDLSGPELLKGLGAQLLWILIGFGIFKFAWKHAIKRYSAVGG